MPQADPNEFITTREEYDELPPKIQRKFFTPLDRSRFSGEVSEFAPQQSQQSLGAKLKKKFSQHFTDESTQTHTLTRNNVTQEDAMFFARLPEKVRLSKFSNEEREILKTRKEEAVVQPSRDEISILCDRYLGRPPSLQSCSSGPSSPSSCGPDDNSPDNNSPGDNSPIWTESDKSFRLHLDWTQEKWDHLLECDREDLAEFEIPLIPEYFFPRKRFLGYLSPHTASHEVELYEWAPKEEDPPVSSTPKTTLDVRRGSDTSSSSVHQTETHPTASAPPPANVLSPTEEDDPPTEEDNPPVRVVNSKAVHYKDPETRLKLREFMTSEAKFDEAIQFGFPSFQSPPQASGSTSFEQTATVGPVNYSRPRPRTKQGQAFTFLDDSVTSASGSASVRDTQSDVRSERANSSVAPGAVSSLGSDPGPSVESFQPSSLYTSQNATQISLRSQAMRVSQNTMTSEWPPREATIRMTLTNPNVRARESLLYPLDKDPWQLDNQLGTGVTATRTEKEKKGLRRILSKRFH